MARALWKGTLGFGLVNISVELLSAEKTDELDLDLLDRRDNARIGYLKINKTTQQPVPSEDIVRGFAVAEDRYVILTPEDIKSANPKATQSIDIFGFVDADTVPRVFFAKPYYVSALKGSERAYALLRDVLRKSGRLALAHIVIHTRQHVAAVYPMDGALVVQLLRYAVDIKSPDDAGVKPIPAASSATTKELAMAEQLVGAMEEVFAPESYRDSYRDDLLKLIESRSGSARTASSRGKEAVSQPTKVLDLVAALQRSLAKNTSPGTARKPAQSATAARTRASGTKKSASRSVTKSATKSSAKTAKRSPTKKVRGRVA